MKSWIKLLLLLLTLQGVANATPRSDFFATLDDTSAYSKAVDDPTYKTQALRLLNLISTASSGGGGGVVTQPTGSNLHTVVDSGTLVCTQPTGTNLHTVVDSGTITSVTSITNPVAVTGTFWQATQPVSGTVTANAGTNLNTSALALDATLTGGTQKTKIVDTGGTNVAVVSSSGGVGSNLVQVAGTAADVNSGVKSAGTLRVVLATDQPALTNKLLVTPDSVALPANQSVNTSQINGVTPLMGNGVSGTGAQRVTIASDSTGVVSLATGANTIGALTANQSTNIAQMNGVATTMGNGVSGTGVQRVTIASDSTANIATIGTSVVPGTAATNLGKAEDAAAASGDTGVAFLVKRLDAPVANAGTSADSDYAHPVSDNFGRLWAAAVQTPVIDQGLTQHRLVSAATTNATVVKASQGNLYNIEAFNNGAAAAYLKFYNIATSPTVGTTTTTKVLMIPPGGGLTLNSVNGIQFSTGISYAIVTNLVDTDATAIAINQVAVNLDYK